MYYGETCTAVPYGKKQPLVPDKGTQSTHPLTDLASVSSLASPASRTAARSLDWSFSTSFSCGVCVCVYACEARETPRVTRIALVTPLRFANGTSPWDYHCYIPAYCSRYCVRYPGGATLAHGPQLGEVLPCPFTGVARAAKSTGRRGWLPTYLPTACVD